MLFQFWQQPGHLLAIKTKNREITYGELQTAVLKWITFLNNQTISSGRNGFITQDPFYTDSLILAHIFLGRTFVPFHKNWTNSSKMQVTQSLNLDQVFNDEDAKRILNLDFDRKLNFSKIPSSGLMSLFLTSGSTGTSKAVGVEYKQFSSLLKSICFDYPLKQGARVAQCFLPSFDPYYAMMALCYGQGGSLNFIDSEDHFQLSHFCNENKIEFFASVPTLVELNQRHLKDACTSIKKTIFTGESLKKETVRNWQIFAPNSEIENLYGPVETTVWASRYKLNLELPLPDKIPIGRPIGDMQFNIENEMLLIRGPQVAKGYWIEDSWKLFENEFRTKDRVEVNSQGEYIFLGREDSLLKISGERLDLEDIENEVFNRFQVLIFLIWSEKNHGLNLVLKESIEVKQVIEFLKLYLTGRFQIKSIQKIKAWPLTETGKRNRRQVKTIIEEFL